MPTSHNATLPPIMRKDDERLGVIVYDEVDALKNITGDTLIFEARLKITDFDPVIRKTTAVSTEIEKTAPTLGEAVIYIDDNDTLFVTKDLVFQCTLEAIDPAGRNSTIMFNLPVRWRP